MPCFQYCVKSPKHPFHTWSSPKKMGYHFQLPKWESNDTQPWFRPFWTSPTKYCMSDLNSSYILEAFAASLIDETTWSTLKRCDETSRWTELATLGCTAANLSKANGSKNHHFGDHDFWCRLQANCSTELSILHLQFWAVDTGLIEHIITKTLKEIFESHVRRCHITLHLDFYDRNFMAKFPESWGPWLCAATMHGLLLSQKGGHGGLKGLLY